MLHCGPLVPNWACFFEFHIVDRGRSLAENWGESTADGYLSWTAHPPFGHRKRLGPPGYHGVCRQSIFVVNGALQASASSGLWLGFNGSYSCAMRMLARVA
jgi:hypothetical protein